MWRPISTAPYDRELRLAVIEDGDVHALVFACRRVLGGWTNAHTNERIPVSPTHWQAWDEQALDETARDKKA